MTEIGIPIYGDLSPELRELVLDRVAREAANRLAPGLRKKGEVMPWVVHEVERDGVRVALIAVVSRVDAKKTVGNSNSKD